MYSADLESKIMNFVKSQKHVDTIVKRIEDGLTIKSITDARVMITELAGLLKSKQVEFE